MNTRQILDTIRDIPANGDARLTRGDRVVDVLLRSGVYLVTVGRMDGGQFVAIPFRPTRSFGTAGGATRAADAWIRGAA